MIRTTTINRKNPFRINVSIITVLLILFFNQVSFSQPCNFPFSPSNTCDEAPLICNLDGFCSRNTAAVNSGTPNAFCGQVENNNWVAFIAGSTTFEIQMNVSNCTQGGGLQAQFFSTNDCNDFTAVSNCLDPVLGIDNLVCDNLVIGDKYYLMMDGKGGDVCDYTYTLISGVILSPASVLIEPVNFLCEGSTVMISSTAVSPNSTLSYSWTTASGNILSNTTSSNIEVDAPGFYNVFVEDNSGCTASTTVEVVEVLNPVLTIGTPDVLNCVSNTTETLSVFVDPPNGFAYEYSWTTANGNIISGGDTNIPIVDTPGNYSLTVTNEFGCSNTATVEVLADVNTPVAEAGEGGEIDCITPEIELNSMLSSLGQDFSYAWSTLDGNIVSGENGLTLIVDAPGLYQLQVTNDINGCTALDEVTVTINEAEPNGASIRTIQPCFGETKGSIIIDSVFGGIGPFVYSFDSLPFTSFNILSPAFVEEHLVVVQDATGCEWKTTIDVTPQPELQIDLGPDQTVPLGCEVKLQALTNYPPALIDTLIWNSDLVCSPVCDTALIILNQSTYRVQIRDLNGCTENDDITFFINKNRNVFIPNVFSPNADGQNDYFMIYGGKDVVEVKTFSVYNRWGEVLFKEDNFPPNDPLYSWDGELNNKRLNDNVFIFYAEIEFLDGWIEAYQGDVSILR